MVAVDGVALKRATFVLVLYSTSVKVTLDPAAITKKNAILAVPEAASLNLATLPLLSFSTLTTDKAPEAPGLVAVPVILNNPIVTAGKDLYDPPLMVTIPSEVTKLPPFSAAP